MPLRVYLLSALGGIRLHNRILQTAPGKAEGLAVETGKLIDLIGDFADNLPGGYLPGAEHLIELITTAGDAAVDAAMRLQGDALPRTGVSIWLQVSGECCEKESCCLFSKRLDWQEKVFWTRCSANDPNVGTPEFPGFGFNDASGIKAALPECITSAVNEFSLRQNLWVN